jgi:hypothetical protein
MRKDQIFVLLLVVLLPMSGCFDGSVGDAEGTDNSGDNNSSTETQERIWYSSGGTYQTTWNQNNVTAGGNYCVEWNIEYDECVDDRWIETFSDWNTTECTDAGGVATPTSISSSSPICTIELSVINTTSGEALLIYQWDSFSLQTTCDGVSVSTGKTSQEYLVITGSAMDCSHRLFTTLTYDSQSIYNGMNGNTQSNSTVIWSIVYAIQDVTVV